MNEKYLFDPFLWGLAWVLVKEMLVNGSEAVLDLLTRSDTFSALLPFPRKRARPQITAVPGEKQRQVEQI